MTETGVTITALASALSAATSSVLQHRSARRAPHDQTHRLLGHLLLEPIWIAGIVAAILGLVFHAIALANGQLVVVQPLLVSGMLFALPLSTVLERKRPSATEWLLALLLVIGLAMFLLAARPSAGRVALDADALAWSTVGGLGVIVVLALFGVFRPGGHAPALLGTAAGVGYGVVAALLKQSTALARSGIGHLLSDWPVYAFILIGAVALVLTQMAYRAGPLAHSMPALTITDPAVSVFLGALAFHERLASDALSITAEVAGFAIMAAAAVQLARRNKEDLSALDPPESEH